MDAIKGTVRWVELNPLDDVHLHLSAAALALAKAVPASPAPASDMPPELSSDDARALATSITEAQTILLRMTAGRAQ